MALINCPECRNQVSDAAATCPHCGVTVAAANEERTAGARLTTTQETTKKLKVQVLLSSAVIAIGILMLVMGNASTTEPIEAVVLPGIVLLGGLGWLVVTKIRIWWHHK